MPSLVAHHFPRGPSQSVAPIDQVKMTDADEDTVVGSQAAARCTHKAIVGGLEVSQECCATCIKASRGGASCPGPSRTRSTAH
jgi:hypothetical protein